MCKLSLSNIQNKKMPLQWVVAGGVAPGDDQALMAADGMTSRLRAINRAFSGLDPIES